MFDKIKLIADSKLHDINHIVRINNLTEVVRKGAKRLQTFDNNGIQKNEKGGGMYIKVDVEKEQIIIEGSLSKYYYKQLLGISDNYSFNFSINQAFETFALLENNTGITLHSAQLKHLETSLNLYVSEPPINYMSKVISITNKRGEVLPFFENPMYKNKSEIVTNMHKAKRKYYKLYDKVHELVDNRKLKLNEIPETPILRIETVWKKIEKQTLREFLQPVNLNEHLKEFQQVWNSLLFEKQVITPKKTTNNMLAIIKELLKHENPQKLLEQYKEEYRNGLLTEKQHRTKREFIEKKWQTFKNEIQVISFSNEIEFKEHFRNEFNNALSN